MAFDIPTLDETGGAEPASSTLDVGHEVPSGEEARKTMQETTRSRIASALVLILAGLVGAVVFLVGLGRLDATAITQTVFPTLQTLVATALGFYFGAQTVTNSIRPAAEDRAAEKPAG